MLNLSTDVSLKKKIILVVGLALSLSACGDNGGVTAPTKNVYYIKGDPKLLLSGSQANSTSPFTVSNVDELSEYSLVSMVSFAEREKEALPKTNDQILEENAAPTEQRQAASYKLTLTQTDVDTYLAQVENYDIEFFLKADREGRLQVQSVGSKSEKNAVQVLHWSQTADKSALSFLVQTESPDAGVVIAAFYFQNNEKVSEVEIPLYEKAYLYLAGPGVGVRWQRDKPLEIGICGQKDGTFMQDAVRSWSDVLKDRLELKLIQAETFAPFSDLNQRCIYRVQLYRESAFGITITPLNMRSGEIVDSDILIFEHSLNEQETQLKKENYDLQVQRIAMERIKTITYHHELGHLLGLSHQFTGKRSVMSYDFDSPQLSRYDIEAIQTLYPLKKDELTRPPRRPSN